MSTDFPGPLRTRAATWTDPEGTEWLLVSQTGRDSLGFLDVATEQLVREDTPWYIAAAFPKIFQTGQGDYWAYQKQRQARGLDVPLQEWFQHVLRGRDGRALKHPRFFYFAVNTFLRNKAVRSKSYFVKREFGADSYQSYTPKEMLKMGKAGMTRVLCAYEGNLPGSAAEKLQQRGDLEAMFNQLEEESLQKATAAMPAHHTTLVREVQEMDTWLERWTEQENVAKDAHAEQLLEDADDGVTIIIIIVIINVIIIIIIVVTTICVQV